MAVIKKTITLPEAHRKLAAIENINLSAMLEGIIRREYAAKYEEGRTVSPYTKVTLTITPEAEEMAKKLGKDICLSRSLKEEIEKLYPDEDFYYYDGID